MPRDGSGVYSLPAGTAASPNTTIESSKYNAFGADLVSDANAARPITAGGTGAPTAVGAADNLSPDFVNVASATTCDIGAASSPNVNITGTTTITGFGTKTAGVKRFLKFAGSLTLTHNGTSLILPGAANITTAAGDTAVFVSEGSGNWRCLGYQKASGLAVKSSGWETIATRTPSNATSEDFTDLSDYIALEIDFFLQPLTDGTSIQLQTSSDNGSNYDAGASDYVTRAMSATGVSPAGNGVSTSAAYLSGLTNGIGNLASEGSAGFAKIYQFNQASVTRVITQTHYRTAAGLLATETVAADRAASTAMNAIRIKAGTGNITGWITIRGLRG